MNNITRRDFVRYSAGSAAVLVAGSGFAAPNGASKPSPVVETTYGKVRGTTTDGVNLFKGIHYGADTSGKNRFLPPQRPASWAGVQDMNEWGHIAPQRVVPQGFGYSDAIRWYDQPGGQSEDCLVLNVWSPAVNDGGKRAVLVCFHGGGFTSGSGNHFGFNGEHAARHEDVVCVTVNHRLGVLGYLHLADHGAPDEYAHSGVAGMLDLVASLEWIRDNIKQFGGDPDRVMIFGQSGGGSKTTTLQAMPAAHGLFHTAGVQSGSSLRMRERETAMKATDALLSNVELTKGQLMELKEIPFEKLIAAQGLRASFGPVVDGDALPRHPFDPDAPQISKDIPLIVGVTLDDAALALRNFDLDWSGLAEIAKGIAGESANTIVSAYRDEYPDANPFKIQSRMFTDRRFRAGATAMADRKAEQGGAPTYSYLVTYEAPYDGGKYGAVHGIDVELVMRNYGGGLTGTSDAARMLAEKVGGSWAQFAKSGDPNIPGLPTWPKYNTTNRPTLIIDKNLRVENDPGGALRELWETVSA